MLPRIQAAASADAFGIALALGSTGRGTRYGFDVALRHGGVLASFAAFNLMPLREQPYDRLVTMLEMQQRQYQINKGDGDGKAMAVKGGKDDRGKKGKDYQGGPKGGGALSWKGKKSDRTGYSDWDAQKGKSRKGKKGKGTGKEKGKDSTYKVIT